MKNDPLEEKALEAYRSFLAGEVARPEVKNDKRLFMQSHFQTRPVWYAGAGALLPVMAFACLFIFLHIFNPRLNPQAGKVQVDADLADYSIPEMMTSASAPKMIPIKVPPILVKRATSQVGQPMIYQRKVNQKPVTVIWVFTGTGMSV